MVTQPKPTKPPARSSKNEESKGASVTQLRPPKLGAHRGQEIVQQGAGGIVNALPALRAYLRLNAKADMEIGSTGIVCFRYTVNGEGYQPVVTMEDKLEWAPKFRFHEAFIAPDQAWDALEAEANRVMDQIAEAREKDKGVQRIAKTDGPTKPVGKPRDANGVPIGE